MTLLQQRRLWLCLALLLAVAPLLLAQAPPIPQASGTQHWQGRVVPLKDLLDKISIRLAPEAAPHWLALVTDNGKVYPLIRDDGARMFFTDPSVRNRPMKLTGRLFADTHLLQVLDIHSVKNGQLHEIYYWCDICSIRRNAGGVCECCGGPMELREVPAK